MQDEITQLYFSHEPIDENGRVYLMERGLDIPLSFKNGICSRGDYIYFLYTINGEVVRWKSRSMKDKKEQRTSILSEEDKKTFKMPFFSQYRDPTSDDLFITEGEFDSIAMKQLGAKNCVSLPNGSGSVESSFRNNIEFLQQFKTIYIAFDMDEPGKQAALKAMSLINASKYRRINFPAPCKDANDFIKENPYADSNDLEALMANAQRVENKKFTHILDLPDSYYDPLDYGISSGWKRIDGILGGIRPGEITVITADTGAGKTTFTLNLIKNLAEQKHGVLINSYEMNPKMVNRKVASVVLRKQMKLHNFSTEDIYNYKTWMHDKNVRLNISNEVTNIDLLRKEVEIACVSFDIKYILIDHFDYIYANGSKSTDLENINEAMRELHVLAMQHQIHIVLVVHPTKVPDNKIIQMNDIKGSSAIKQYADNIIILTRMDRLDANDLFRVMISVRKNRLLGTENFFYVRYNPQIEGYEDELKQGELLCKSMQSDN